MDVLPICRHQTNPSRRTTSMRIVLPILVVISVCLLPLLYYSVYYSLYYSLVPHDHPHYYRNATPTTVTRIIHQSWKTKDLPPRFQRWSQSWRECYPSGWQFKLWTDKDNDNFIQEHYPWFWNTYQHFPLHINRVDVVRYFYLFHYGGIYADLDCECLQPFQHLLEGHDLVFGAMSGQYGGVVIPEGYTQNSFMYSTPRHLFWLELIHLIRNGTGKGGVEERTGPIILGTAINNYRTRFPKAGMKIYPPEYFNPFSWMSPPTPECKTLNRMNDVEIQQCRNYFKGKSFVVQYHSQTWRSGKIL